MPDCRTHLAHHAEELGGAVVIGEEAHIVARSEDGPRGKSPLTLEQRDDYSNLMLLCPTHHALIDKIPEDYPVDLLLDRKSDHETWVRDTLGSKIDRDEVKWAIIVDKLCEKLQLDAWSSNISPLFNGGPASLTIDTEERLRECALWIATRPWPKGQRQLKSVIINVGRFLNQLLAVFGQYAEPHKHGSRIVFPMFYKNSGLLDKEHYDALLKEYTTSREYMSDLALELTRYVNLLGDLVRQGIDPSFREEEGYTTLVIEGQPFQFNIHVVRFTHEVTDSELGENALEFFEEARTTRHPRYEW